jgi:hypothetical protein
MDAFVESMGLAKTPLCVLTHGYILGQYGLLWARQNSEHVNKLAILNVPLGRKTGLRPELAPYKAAMPFMRPKPDASFSGDLYNAAGLAYVIQYDDAQVCNTLHINAAHAMRLPICSHTLQGVCSLEL